MESENKITGFKALIAYLLTPTKTKRVLFFLFSDILVIAFSFYAAFYLRFGFTFPGRYELRFWYWLGAFIVLKVFALFLAGLYNINWRFVGLTELSNLLKVGIVVTAAVFIINLTVIRKHLPGFDLPRGIVVIEAFLCFILIGILRIAKRLRMQFFNGGKMGRNTLIIGADHTGERLIKELIAYENGKSHPIVIVDEDPMKIGTKIHGLPVLGGYQKLPEIISRYKIESVLINLPRATHKNISSLFSIINPLGITDIKVVPRIDEYEGDVFRPKNIKQLAIEDLLSREAVQIDSAGIESYIKGKVVLVTGAAGSIGSEILRQLMNFGARQIIGFEIDETEIFNLEIELENLKRAGQEVKFIVGDVRERKKMEQVFARYKPQVVFHAAAYKHVPMMENFPEEAVKTNVLGTLNIVEFAVAKGCEKFINISTDKAVNPSSVMGASKRLAEIICTAHNSGKSRPHMVSVRFGNVLGSRGSVVPIFLDQIKKGGPLRITHKDMKRYFMSIPEAVLLVLQAAFMGEGGEVFVLDMGEPVRIVKLAETLVLLNNLVPYKDVDIVFTGLRPGEKLFEELLTAEEGTRVTAHEKIFVARNNQEIDSKQVAKIIKKIEKSIHEPGKIRGILAEHVPFYRPG